MDSYQNLLEQLAEFSESPPFEVGDDGALELFFNDRIAVTIQPDRARKHVSIYSVVGRLGEEVSGLLLLGLLQASLFGRDTNGATFAVEEATGQIVLQRTERLHGLLALDFEETLSEFVDAAEFWLARLAAVEAGTEEALQTEADGEDSAGSPWMSV